MIWITFGNGLLLSLLLWSCLISSYLSLNIKPTVAPEILIATITIIIIILSQYIFSKSFVSINRKGGSSILNYFYPQECLTILAAFWQGMSCSFYFDNLCQDNGMSQLHSDHYDSGGVCWWWGVLLSRWLLHNSFYNFFHCTANVHNTLTKIHSQKANIFRTNQMMIVALLFCKMLNHQLITNHIYIWNTFETFVSFDTCTVT